jgi:hypothetical protein
MTFYHNPHDVEFAIKFRSSRESTRYSQDDAHSISSTQISSSISDGLDVETMTTTSAISSPHQIRQFVDRCLIIRILYEQCGHIFWLSLHEPPCQSPHYGILPSTSPLALLSRCPDMAAHLVIKHSICEDCRPVPVVPKSNFAWLKRDTNMKSEVKLQSNTLPIRQIIARRENWKKVVDAQDERIRKNRIEKQECTVRR